MELIEFPEQTVVYGKGQKKYAPLPAHRFEGDEGRIAFCWKLSVKERIKVLFTGVLWHQVLTFKKSLQPQHLSTEKPEMGK